MATVITPDFYIGNHVSNFCPNAYHDDDKNHCAHFVSHVRGFGFGYTCIKQTGKGTGGANIRVQELFARCGDVGLWENKPPLLASCLAFVTDLKNVDLNRGTMDNIPNKHVGIFHQDHIYHYSNSKNRVVSQIPQQFRLHYLGKNIRVYYGSFPS